MRANTRAHQLHPTTYWHSIHKQSYRTSTQRKSRLNKSARLAASRHTVCYNVNGIYVYGMHGVMCIPYIYYTPGLANMESTGFVPNLLLPQCSAGCSKLDYRFRTTRARTRINVFRTCSPRAGVCEMHCVYVLYDYVNVDTEPTRVLRQYQCIGKMCDVLRIEYIVRTFVCLT